MYIVCHSDKEKWEKRGTISIFVMRTCLILQARAEADEVRKLTSSSSIKDKYKEAVVEGNKVITSQPVTIEKAPAGEDPFPSRNDDEDFKITVSFIFRYLYVFTAWLGLTLNSNIDSGSRYFPLLSLLHTR